MVVFAHQAQYSLMVDDYTIVLKLLVLGMVALTLSGLGGLVGGLIYAKFSKEPFNPLVGLAAVS